MLTGDQLDAYIADLVHGHEEDMVVEMLGYLAYEMVRQTGRGDELDSLDLVTLRHAALNAKRQLRETHMKYRERINKQIDEQVAKALEHSDDQQVSVLKKVHPSVKGLPYSTHFKEMSHHTIRGIREIVERQNLQMEESLERAWYHATAEAVTAYNHGLRTKEDSLTRGVLKLMRDGLTTIDYVSGIKSKLDVALRRHMKAQLSQTIALMNEIRDDEYDHDLVYVNSVPSPRPSHADWEQQVFSRSGRDDKYPERTSEMLDPITGIGGINCRHVFIPYYDPIQLSKPYTPPYSPELGRELTQDEWYEATQKQRYYERQIRDAKRKQFAAERAGDGQAAATQKLRLGKYQQRQKKLVEGNGLARLYEREHAYGLPYQPRGSAVWAMQENAGKTKQAGAISGALNDKNDPYHVKRTAHANKQMKAFRNSDKSNLINKISKSSGVPRQGVETALNHLIYDKHDLAKGYTNFDADYDIVQSLKRLQVGKDVKPHDITLIHHEAYEAFIMNEIGYSYEDAHKLAERVYNYKKELDKFLGL